MSIETNTEESLIRGVLNHGPDILSNCLADHQIITVYKQRLEHEFLRDYPIPAEFIDHNQWYMPKEYREMDIESYLADICPKENRDRLDKELELYRKNHMLPLLRMMKYIVDTLRSNGVLWGVGRGSSVASYVLFLLGVHRIDSVKYNLPLDEFFKGGENG